MLVWSNSNPLHSSQWINFLALSYRVLYSFYGEFTYVINCFFSVTRFPYLAFLHIINFCFDISGFYRIILYCLVELVSLLKFVSLLFCAYSSASLPPFFWSRSVCLCHLSSARLSALWLFSLLLSICLSSFLVQFKNGPEYLTKAAAYVFISLIIVLL